MCVCMYDVPREKENGRFFKFLLYTTHLNSHLYFIYAFLLSIRGLDVLGVVLLGGDSGERGGIDSESIG